jgi:hypothetical protein
MIPNSKLDTLDTTSRLSLKSLLSRKWREVRENLKDMSNVSNLVLQIALRSLLSTHPMQVIARDRSSCAIEHLPDLQTYDPS